MEKYIVDRFEEGFVVLESEYGGTTDVKKSLLPENIGRGDVVIYKDGIYFVDKEETEKRKSLIKEKMKRLFDKK